MIPYSIIIPIKDINDYVRETVKYILALEYQGWELIIVTNSESLNEWSDQRIKLITSGRVGPAVKRDLGARKAIGQILVFLDDDSYPNHNLLTIANQFFKDANIIAIGGPAITPPNESFLGKVSGAVFLSKFSGGNPERYVSIGPSKEVDDWPSVNLMVRRKDFLEIGGFDRDYWPGEDTYFCAKLIELKRTKIVYVPQLKVWHHRRTGLVNHLKQVGRYGLNRGYFAKKYPEISRKLIYFIPSVFVVFIFGTFIIPIIWKKSLPIFIIAWIIYILALVKIWFDIRKYESISICWMALPYVFLTHIWYGLNFIRGLFSKNIVSKLR